MHDIVNTFCFGTCATRPVIVHAIDSDQAIIIWEGKEVAITLITSYSMNAIYYSTYATRPVSIYATDNDPPIIDNRLCSKHPYKIQCISTCNTCFL